MNGDHVINKLSGYDASYVYTLNIWPACHNGYEVNLGDDGARLILETSDEAVSIRPVWPVWRGLKLT